MAAVEISDQSRMLKVETEGFPDVSDIRHKEKKGSQGLLQSCFLHEQLKK